jgi:hypothetical protein
MDRTETMDTMDNEDTLAYRINRAFEDCNVEDFEVRGRKGKTVNEGDAEGCDVVKNV